MIRNSPEKVFDTECVLVIVDRAVSARFKQVAECAYNFSLVYDLKKLKGVKEDLKVRYMKAHIA
jgi:hypothetical protein